ncbi:ABC transporter permease [Planctomicrobium piriforme]|uniref:Lipoprotein-releasing system permease protein n=1 Tax=Planctomicrobium piriforme TaxID=1576369 RepID=A0A1I3AYF8_9PLAN|nr:FtsX-like permease family protein [Planctomicrobium piriforme]SFH54769.1 lipoprotein-releasing system permease protein [Planctomicrobium piriforme]
MYKFLLANRYLRTRFIALASVISVTLGVATMIVVNSVMSGFSSQMRERIHATLGDVMVEATSMDGTDDPEQLLADVDALAGRYITAVTPTVEIYGMMSFRWMGQDIYRLVTLVGIVPETKNQVSPLAEYLLSRQRIVENDEVVREPLRKIKDPLDWSLTKQGVEDRLSWLKARHFEDLNREFRSPELPPSAEGVSPVNATKTAATEFSLEHAHNQTAAADDNALQDPFASATPVEKVDPEEPLPARIFVGAGLISFPYKERDTGLTRTQYMAAPGQDVILTTIKAGQPEPAPFKATIVDVFKSGMSEYDSNLVFCNLEELQYVRGMLSGPDPTHPHKDLNWKKGAITTLQIKIKDYRDAPEVVRRLSQGLNYKYQVRTWEQKQGPLLEAVAVESAILNVLLFLIITVAGFGILAIFYMIVVEKTRDIGILKALGASSRGIMMIFLSYGLSLGVVGSGAGVILGLLFVEYINEVEALLSMITGRKVFDESIYYFHEIPTAVHPSMVLWVAFGAMLIAVLASVLPARRAAALHPVRALRYE